MIRGTSHTFRFDCSDIIDNISDIKTIYVIFDQTNNKETPIIKTFEVSLNDGDPPVAIISGDSGCSIVLETKEVVIDLTPEETIKFTEDKQLMVQLKGEKYDSTVFANYIQYFTVYPMLEPIAANEDISGCQCKELPVASTSTLGGVKIGDGVTIQDGVISTKTYNVATTENDGLLSASDKGKLDALSADGSPYTTIRTPQDSVDEVNISSTARSGEIVLGTASKLNYINNDERTYLFANEKFAPTCATLYNFVQISKEEISATLPSGSYYVNVELGNPVTTNEIVVPVGSSASSYYVTLHQSSAHTVHSITFHRAEGQSLDTAMTVSCLLMRLKVMKS